MPAPVAVGEQHDILVGIPAGQCGLNEPVELLGLDNYQFGQSTWFGGRRRHRAGASLAKLLE